MEYVLFFSRFRRLTVEPPAYNIFPPSGVATVTFTAPIGAAPTYSSAVAVPESSQAPPHTVTGPAGDTNCDGSNQWALAYGPLITGCLPTNVGVSGGITPSAVPPDSWTGVWTDPVPPHVSDCDVANPSKSWLINPSSLLRPFPPQRHSCLLLSRGVCSCAFLRFIVIHTSQYSDPNPYPPPTAKSETFARSGTTTVIPIPTKTTTLIIAGATITLQSGGTPVHGLLPTDVTEIGGITPTWSAWCLYAWSFGSNPDVLVSLALAYGISPPPGASTVTFTAPLTSKPTYSSKVPVPSSSGSPPATVSGPPGDHNLCGSSNVWSLLFGGIISGCMPGDVGINGGITPRPVPPPDWTGTWPNPYPLSDGEPGDESPTSSRTTSTSTSSSSSTSSCQAVPTAAYNLPDDSDNADWEDDGTDPDYTRKREERVQERAGGRSRLYVNASGGRCSVY